MEEVFKFISKEFYEEEKQKLKDGQTIEIYEDDKVIISLRRRDKKTYTIIEEFGEKNLNTALNEMYNLV